ncbi:MAG: shikimate kinase [Nitrososphaerota archaeon]
MKAVAEVHGAVTIVNAIATGRGAALGIGLKTVAEVEIEPDSRSIYVQIEGSPDEDTLLAKEVVKEVFKRFGVEGCGARVITRSDIPIARGLKSSSSASSSIALATVAALGKTMDDLSIIDIAVDASIKAGVSITGAFDDATACYFGGISITENYSRRIVKQERVDEELNLAIYVPEKKFFTKDVNRASLSGLSPLIDACWSLALRGRYLEALTFNGMIHSFALGFDLTPALKALEAGALASGLSGKGPAVVAICDKGHLKDVTSAWSNLQGSILLTKVNNEKATVKVLG